MHAVSSVAGSTRREWLLATTVPLCAPPWPARATTPKARAILRCSGLVDLRTKLRRGEISAIEATNAYLARIASIDPALHAYVTVTADRARERAAAAERDVRRAAWGACRPADGAQGLVRDGRHSDDRRIEAVRAARAGPGRHPGRAPRRQPAPSRSARPTPTSSAAGSRRSTRSSAPRGTRATRSDRRRLERRIGRRGRGSPRRCRHRHGHGREHPHSRRILRVRRLQADLRAPEHRRRAGRVADVRSRRLPHPHGGRSRAAAAGDDGRGRRGPEHRPAIAAGRERRLGRSAAIRIGVPRAFFFDELDGDGGPRDRGAADTPEPRRCRRPRRRHARGHHDDGAGSSIRSSSPRFIRPTSATGASARPCSRGVCRRSSRRRCPPPWSSPAAHRAAPALPGRSRARLRRRRRARDAHRPHRRAGDRRVRSTAASSCGTRGPSTPRVRRRCPCRAGLPTGCRWGCSSWRALRRCAAAADRRARRSSLR